MEKYTKDLTIGEVIRGNDDAKVVLMGFGMHCFSCPMSQMETLEQAAAVHGVDVDFMVEKLNELAPPMKNTNIKNVATKKTSKKSAVSKNGKKITIAK